MWTLDDTLIVAVAFVGSLLGLRNPVASQPKLFENLTCPVAAGPVPVTETVAVKLRVVGICTEFQFATSDVVVGVCATPWVGETAHTIAMSAVNDNNLSDNGEIHLKAICDSFPGKNERLPPRQTSNTRPVLQVGNAGPVILRPVAIQFALCVPAYQVHALIATKDNNAMGTPRRYGSAGTIIRALVGGVKRAAISAGAGAAAGT
jgi:hypothetical protein